MARLVVKNENQTYSCYDEIGLCDQNKNTVLDSIVTTTGRTYVTP